MARIELTHGLFALVDDADFHWLNQWKWHVNRSGYAARCTYEAGRKPMILMHRAILGAASGQMVDHIDRCRLDNRRSNLRFATFSQNLINRHQPNASGYRGVRVRGHGRFEARIKPASGPQMSLGYFNTIEEAARAYDAAAIALHGQFAQTNFPPSDPLEDRGQGRCAGALGSSSARRLA